MTKGEPLGLLIRFALPLVIGNLLQAAYSIVDRVIVGQFVGADAFSAVGVTYAPSNMFASVCIGMSTGAGIIVAQYFGAGKKEDIAKAIANTAYISIALAIITSIVGIAATEPFLHLLNTPENLMAPAALYMRIYLGGLVAVSAYYTPFSIIRALGDSRTPLIFLAVCSLLNIVLDFLFVGLFGMGVKGAAIATILAQSISAISCMIYATVKIEYIQLAFQYGKPDRRLIYKTIRIGIPTAVQYALMYLSTVIMQSVVNSFGNTVIGAYTAVSQMELLVLEIYNGVGAAVMTFTGQNIGSGKIERVRDGLLAVVKICGGIAVLLLLFFWIGGDHVMGIFVSDNEITHISTMGIRISSFFFMACGMNRIILALLNGAGDAGYAVINGGTEIVSRIMLTFLLTAIPLIGYFGIFLTTGLTWFIAACVGMIRCKQGTWNDKRLTV